MFSVAPSSSGNSLPQSTHLTVDTQFQQQQQQQQQQSSTPSSAASGNSLSSATSNSTGGGGGGGANSNTNSSPVSTPMPSSSTSAIGLSSSLLLNDTPAMVQQPISVPLRPTTASNTPGMIGSHSLNMILNTNAFHPHNAFTSAAMMQSSAGISGTSKLSSSEQLGSVGTNSSDLLTDPSGNILSPSNSVSSLTTTGVSLCLCVCLCLCLPVKCV